MSYTDWPNLLNRTDVLVLDSETTGLNRTTEILELAILDTTGAIRLNTLIMPQGNIPADATAVHGITRAELEAAQAPAWPAVHAAVADLLAGAAVVCIYNAKYDVRLLGQSSARYGLRLPPFRASCLMLDYAAYRREPDLRGRGWRWHTLVAAAEREAVPIGNAHRAVGDARLALGLMRAVSGHNSSRP